MLCRIIVSRSKLFFSLRSLVHNPNHFAETTPDQNSHPGYFSNPGHLPNVSQDLQIFLLENFSKKPDIKIQKVLLQRQYFQTKEDLQELVQHHFPRSILVYFLHQICQSKIFLTHSKREAL